MADNPKVQVSLSIVSGERFVLPFILRQRLEREARHCYGAPAAAGMPPEAAIVLLEIPYPFRYLG
jgi:hypothetical protein